MKVTRVGVGVIIIRNGKVLMGKRIGSHGRGSWSPPGGHVEFNEDPEDTAVRETFEETGLKVHSPRFVAITSDIYKKEKKHYITLYYICKYRSGEARIMEPDKFEGWGWFKWNKLPTPIFLAIKDLRKQKFNPLVYDK